MRVSLKTILSTAAAVLVSGAIAWAANTVFFTSIGDLVFPFKAPTAAGTGGTIGDITRGGMAPLNGDLSYTKRTPVTGFSYTFGNFEKDMTFTPAGTLSSGTVVMAAAPIDGGRACIFSTQIVTTLTLSANTGQSINNAISALSANVRYCYIYSIGNTTWDRSQ